MRKIFAAVTAFGLLSACNTDQFQQSAYSATVIRNLECGTYDYRCRIDNRRERDAVIAVGTLIGALTP